MSQPNRTRRPGFTLMELLVVIGILAFLLTMLLPVMNKVRQSGYKTNTAAQVNALRAGAEAYHQTFQAYPGPLSDAETHQNAANQPTMAENLVLGLLGGLDASGNYQPDKVGQGPIGRGVNPKQYGVFYEGNAQLNVDLGKLKATPALGRFTDDRGTQAKDSNRPEFVDRFPEPLPILYMRARRGAPGVVVNNNNTPGQYDLRQVMAYTDTTPPLGGKTHGLRTLSDTITEPKGNGPFEAQNYLVNPSEYGSNKTRLTASPRAKDQYILIGAGVDRTYGTPDDITSFGSILP